MSIKLQRTLTAALLLNAAVLLLNAVVVLSNTMATVHAAVPAIESAYGHEAGITGERIVPEIYALVHKPGVNHSGSFDAVYW